MIRKVWVHRDLLLSLIRRQFQLRYRQSVAGFVWAIVPPLVTVAASTLVFHEFVGVETGNIPYPLFVFSALTPWTFLAGSMTGGIPSIAANQAMVTRLAFPRAVLPLSAVGLSLVDLAISGTAFLVFLFATGNTLPLTALWFPVVLVIEMVLVAGVALLGSAMNMFARDVKLAIPIVVQFWLFLTPVMYPLSSVPRHLRDWYQLNPMTGLVETFRNLLVVGRGPDLDLLAPAIVGAGLFLIVGAWYFSATESRFADVI